MATTKKSPVTTILAVLFFVVALGIAGYSMTHSGDGGAARDKCIENMRMIAKWKNHWVTQNRSAGHGPTKEDLLKTPGRVWPECPKGGTYTIGDVGVPVHCSLGPELDHTL